MVCGLADGAETAKDCCTCDAGWNVELPDWFASIVHVPAATKATVEPAMLHTPEPAASTVSVTGRPELAAAVTVYVVPPTVAAAGGGEAKLIVWASRPMAKDCWASGAG
jgi:hypothetical protein